jgi:hypothetical protein
VVVRRSRDCIGSDSATNRTARRRNLKASVALQTDLIGRRQREAQPKIFTSSDKAVHLMQNGLKMAHLFEKSAHLVGDVRAMAIADCLRETYQLKNIYTAADLVNHRTGELFDGYGALNHGVATRMSPAYLTASMRRTRKRITAKIESAKPLVGQNWRFLTLTLPYLKADVATVFAIQSQAIEWFKKRKVWTQNVGGAFFGEELIIGGESTFTFTHFHGHIHTLMLGKYIDQWQLADAWTDCVEKACAKFGVEFLMRNLVSNRLMTHISDVRKYANSKAMKMDEAVQELCKYTTKGSDFEKVPVAEIVEIEAALHGRKMVRDYGIFNNQKGKGEKEKTGEHTSLDTQCTTDGAAMLKPKSKPMSLLQRGIRLIEEGKRAHWLQILHLEMETRRDFRRQQLAFKYPNAAFQTLDGERWFGVSTRPPKVVFSLTEYKGLRDLRRRRVVHET